MRAARKIGLLLLHFAVVYVCAAQPASFNFRFLTSNEGLSDGVVHDIVQDKYGFIWIGTSYGLNRFDGITMKNFFSRPGDSTALLDNFIQTLFCDAKGNIWIGTFKGLSRYSYTTNTFINYSAKKNLRINSINQDKKGNTWVATNEGLWITNSQKTTIEKFTHPGDTSLQNKLRVPIYQILASPEGDWFLATNYGIKIFNPQSFSYSEIRHKSLNQFSVRNDVVNAISLDSSGNLWAASFTPGSVLNKIDLRNHTVKTYDHFIKDEKKKSNNIVRNLMTDENGRVWITSSINGLSVYDEKTNLFHDYKNELILPTSIQYTNNICLYQDCYGIIWIGTSGYGLSYFHPDKNLFYNIYPSQDKKNSIPGIWCRAACEDQQGNLWLGTGSGLAKYDRQKQVFTQFANEEGQKPVIQNNSIRCLLDDDDGNIWIGTAKGLNRYQPSKGRMDFFGEQQGIPLSFFWMMTKDKTGNVWIGARDGLFHYLLKEERFDDLTKNPLLAPYARKNIQALFTDSKNRVWISILYLGVVVYDEPHHKVFVLTVENSLVSDNRVSSFAEDKTGIIWIGTEEGLTAYNPVKNSSRFYTRDDGLPSNRTNNIMVGPLNRVWIGTSNGLCVLYADRKTMRRFNVNDGLLTNQFNEQSAYCTRDGFFIYPTYKGFVMFRPQDYKENQTTPPVYVTSFKVSDKELNTKTNVEELKELHLAHNQNFFSIELAGLNYMNPLQCTYAYKLEPFDKDWIYTNKKEVNYTNVPAGDYTFHYKAITDNTNWNVQEKTIQVSIAAVFYNTWWFRGLILLIFISVLFGFLRYRLGQREKILVLQNKAQLLEKEKALVMYESLKQQLNPHFLFNSLTSLSSLIQQNPTTAKKFLDQLSKIYRYILKSRDSELVPLIEDIKLVQVYSQLQKTRFQKGLEVHINVDEEDYSRRIVPVTLQNLVENAIKHNIIDEDEPLGIDIFVEDGYLVVRNNMQKKNFVDTSNKQGLENMRSLYHYLSGRAIKVLEDENFFTVKIPLI